MDINIVLMGQRIRSARKEKKISSEVLAEKVGIAVESLWHIENGARNTSLQTLSTSLKHWMYLSIISSAEWTPLLNLL